MKMDSDYEWDRVEIPVETQVSKTVLGIRETKIPNKVTIDSGCVDEGVGDISRNKPNIFFTVQKAQKDEPAKLEETKSSPSSSESAKPASTSSGYVTHTYNVSSLPYATDIYVYQQLNTEIEKNHKLSAELCSKDIAIASKDTIIAMKDSMIVEKNSEMGKLHQDVVRLTGEVAALRERVLFASVLSNVGLAVKFDDVNTVIYRPDGK